MCLWQLESRFRSFVPDFPAHCILNYFVFLYVYATGWPIAEKRWHITYLSLHSLACFSTCSVSVQTCSFCIILMRMNALRIQSIHVNRLAEMAYRKWISKMMFLYEFCDHYREYAATTLFVEWHAKCCLRLLWPSKESPQTLKKLLSRSRTHQQSNTCLSHQASRLICSTTNNMWWHF